MLVSILTVAASVLAMLVSGVSILLNAGLLNNVIVFTNNCRPKGSYPFIWKFAYCKQRGMWPIGN